MPNQSLHQLKIMIVETKALDILVLQDMLSAEGYAHHKGLTDVTLMLELFHRYQPDLVVLEIEKTAPGIDQKNNEIPLLRQMRNAIEQTDYRPILALLSQDEPSFKRRVLQQGATDLLIKPLDHTDAMLRVSNLLRARLFHLQRQFRTTETKA